ncbi:MAG: 3-phosphoshikimate 1-carboxyvinyltransferase [Halobacteriales archaeon]
MDVTVRPSRVGGTARAPASKSYSHRAILAAGYAEGARIEDPLVSADTRATARAVEAFGGDVTEVDDGLSVEGFGGRPETPADVIDCANSGTTMRLVTAAAALADGTTVLTGDESLRSRPQGPLLDAIGQLGGRAESTRGNGQAPLVIEGSIAGGTATIPGDVSSQFVTALLMAGAVTDGGIEVDLTTELKSAPYVEITREVLAAFGVDTDRGASGFSVPGGQTYDPGAGAYSVPGDFSSISYLLAAGVLASGGGGDEDDSASGGAGGSENAVRIEGAHPSAQGDTAIVDIVRDMGGDVTWDREAGVLVARRLDLTGTTVGVADTPDLLPTIAVLGAAAAGTTRIEDAEHVRYKETDRVAAMAEALEKMGASLEEEEDSLTIHGSETTLEGATVDGRRDHRIIMSLAVAGLVAEGGTTISDADHVDVSFPGFFGALADLGARVDR